MESTRLVVTLHMLVVNFPIVIASFLSVLLEVFFYGGEKNQISKGKLFYFLIYQVFWHVLFPFVRLS